MRHTFFALFPSHHTAEKALVALHEHGLDDGGTQIRYHDRGLDQGDLALIETDGREGIHRGFIVGAVVGAITVLLAFFLLRAGSHWLLALMFGGLAGGLFGALLRGLVGVDQPDRILRSWRPMLAADGVILTVTTDSLDREREVEDLLARHGAREVEKPLV